ncbi:MAG TPA: DUF4132 domain-containing protein [Gemmatimonadaceae bacterium]|nr:DUF4132 domain-containing protein [Gemmatimonadaceae bacterium]
MKWPWKRAGSVEAFVPPDGSELDAEHRVVSRWVEDALRATDDAHWYQDVELKSQPSGQAMLDAKPDEARRYVHAAAVQTAYWDARARDIRSQGKTEHERLRAHLRPDWKEVWGRRRRAATVVATLMRRTLPFVEADLIALLDLCNGIERLSKYEAPVGAITRALQRFLETHPLSDALRTRLARFAAGLRGSNDTDTSRHGTAVEQLLAGPAQASGAALAPEPNDDAREASAPPSPPPTAAPAGNPAVLDALKRHVGVAGGDAATERLEPDEFLLRADSPLRAEHALLSEMLASVIGTRLYSQPTLESIRGGDRVLGMDPVSTGRLLLAAAERDAAGFLAGANTAAPGLWQSRYASAALTRVLAQRPVTLDRAGLFDFLLYLATRAAASDRRAFQPAFDALLGQVEREAARAPLTEGERYVLYLLRASWISGPPLGIATEVDRLTRLVGDARAIFLVPGEAWTDELNDDLTALPRREREAWIALLRHALSATAARPSGKWLKTGEKLIAAIGQAKVLAAVIRWLPRVTQGGSIARLGAYPGDTRSASELMHEENATCLRGLLWLTPTLGRDGSDGGPTDVMRTVAAVAASAYRKVPGVGPRAIKVGNAAVYALSEMGSPDAVGHLAMLKVRVKFGTAQKEIDKAFNTAAEALSLPRDQIEEMAVPSYGLDSVGVRRETFADGEYIAELRVDGRDVDLHWSRADGKAQKSVPAKVKTDHKDELKELQGAAKDIASMLPAQSERLDAMFLLEKRWPAGVWRERYLDHPLVGTLARRLIWTFTSNGGSHAGAWSGDAILDVLDKPLDVPNDAEVELWHPIGRSVEDVLAWRQWIETHEIRQPFKQAHREVYLLTDAERHTETYSNRFAAHVLRQHQFNALCAARGWKNKLRLMVDDTYPPTTRELPHWGLRAEYWVEGAGTEYGADTNESGVYLHVVTDQVRFYRVGAAQNRAHAGGGGYLSAAAGPGTRGVNEPLPLDEIPALVFSEIMRDVDLFVGVASVGNDPTWQDGGPGGRYRAYWTSYSFGELGETARTRRAILERLVPRLKIASQCTLTERFLLVRGKLRTYKIHLGSGNILMEPNDQYLCIVAARGGATAASDRLFLPFEGDATMSIILSKAFLLADDSAIKDPTIVRQISSR